MDSVSNKPETAVFVGYGDGHLEVATFVIDQRADATIPDNTCDPHVTHTCVDGW